MCLFYFSRLNKIINFTSKLQHILNIFLKYILLIILALTLSNGYAQLLDSLTLSTKKEFKSIKDALEAPTEVYRLNLRKKRITKFPEEIFMFVNLNDLNLSNNKIKNIPSDLNKLEYLQNLNLANNELLNVPPEIALLKNLKILVLNRNKLQTLPKEMGTMYSLRILDIWGTEIDEFPYEISGLKHTLQKLDMRVIYMNRNQQAEILKWFPLTEVLFSKHCNCQ